MHFVLELLCSIILATDAPVPSQADSWGWAGRGGGRGDAAGLTPRPCLGQKNEMECRSY